MSDIVAIINLVNKFAFAYSLENADLSVKTLLSLFTDDATFFEELVGGICTGKSEIEAALQELAKLKFVTETRHLPSGHVVELLDTDNAKVSSHTTVFWKCTPVMVVTWTDVLVKCDGQWLFQRREADAVQKNLEMIGEMQLRGKKQYSHKDDEA
ncbi:unnamed protein product [Peronospora belbahrii]|uniref:SnoaL-like domain-containing protein n=1 Tax=Peronospora belbahrii TaxID=622444 RepID=A0AAU9L3D6_9STRA|nr:unnamed protein product [Peronospora belbahrii]CAH0518713.1 unnamed protein product [Peronospora belbahrii]